jgi:SAM-dependent methyltransferase
MTANLKVPDDLDHAEWIARWDRMQEYYLVARSERLKHLAWLVAATQPPTASVVDVGCGTGSVTAAVLRALPDSRAVGVDLDPAMLVLAEARLKAFGDRVRLVQADLREPAWMEAVEAPVDAVLSATTLHWLGPEQLRELYRQLADLLRPGGLFANADHVGSDSPVLQQSWEQRREEVRATSRPDDAEDWYAFWRAYGRALGIGDVEAYRQALIGEWTGVEAGMPLSWHLDVLRESGFCVVDCFWRCDCDAIYGALR